MRFTAVVSKILPGTYRAGLQALSKADRARISCTSPRKLAGSVALDEALKRSNPNDSRWDYGVGIRDDRRSDQVVWIEVHPASSSHIADMLEKIQWLKQWLGRSAPELAKMTARKDGYVWLASGKVAISPNSPQARKLAQAGISFPRAHLNL